MWKFNDDSLMYRCASAILEANGTVVLSNSKPREEILVDFVVVPLEHAQPPHDVGDAKLVSYCYVDGEPRQLLAKR